MELGLENKVAIITGGSEGIGKAIALGLAQEKVKVAISGRREKQLANAANEIREKTGASIYAAKANMTHKKEVEIFIGDVLKKWNTVHILVNNVGSATKAFFNELTEKNWRNAMNSNLFSSIYCTEQVLPGMRKQKWGRIINIAAVSGKEPSFNLMASNVAKSGLLSFSKTLASEVAADNILVNCVCPGRILSPQIMRLYSEEERRNIASASIPMKRFGKADELSNLVVFIASERSSFITGTVIPVDGGASRGLY